MEWQRSGTLQLKPIFQRREVWTPKAKSFLVDTVTKGLPVPIVFLRRVQDVQTLTSKLEVVDGQQRLRTLFAYIDKTLLKDFDKDKDTFTILPVHNSDIAGEPFSKLSKEVKSSILSYEISTHVFPPDTGDDVVLSIFARLNSTGAKLNHQELRNAEYFGIFKTCAYDLAFRYLHLWRKWDLFDDDDLARMVEVEAASEYMAVVVYGVQGKSQAKLDDLYAKFDDKFPGAEIVVSRVGTTLEAIEESVGKLIGTSPFRRQALFYSLFTACYDHIFGLGAQHAKKKPAKQLPSGLPARFHKCAKLIASHDLPETVLDAMEKATADKGRRDTRHKFLMKSLELESAG
jgi:hypothetical protein